MADDFCLIHHALLGYAPRAGFRGVGATGWSVTIDADGFRTCGGSTESNNGAILAVGDSYTFGEEVSDAETWPAHLQRITGRRVLNGGVSGYGLDQIVLRAEQLAGAHRPSLIIVGFIADDIRRTEMRRLWWRDKPWFTIEEGHLALKGAPVPGGSRVGPVQLRHRLERILIGLAPTTQHLLGYHVRVHPAGLGPVLAKHLIGRLARLQAENQSRVILLAQYHPQVWVNKTFATEERRMTLDVLNCAESLGLATVDTHQRFAAEPTARKFYTNSHMNSRGNSMMASLLAAQLSKGRQ